MSVAKQKKVANKFLNELRQNLINSKTEGIRIVADEVDGELDVLLEVSGEVINVIIFGDSPNGVHIQFENFIHLLAILKQMNLKVLPSRDFSIRLQYFDDLFYGWTELNFSKNSPIVSVTNTGIEEDGELTGAEETFLYFQDIYKFLKIFNDYTDIDDKFLYDLELAETNEQA